MIPGELTPLWIVFIVMGMIFVLFITAIIVIVVIAVCQCIGSIKNDPYVYYYLFPKK